MDKVVMSAKNRTQVGRNMSPFRAANMVPAVIYGAKLDPISVAVEQFEFARVYRQAGSNTVVELDVEGKKENVLIYEVQPHPVTDEPLSVDFLRVKMDEKITTDIPLNFVGESPAVNVLKAIFLTNMDSIEVECLPGALVSEIEVDISGLENFGDGLYISDLKIPEGMEVKDDPEQMIAQVTEPKEEVIEEPEVAEGEEGVAEGEEGATEGEGEAKDEGGDEKSEEGKE